MATHKLSIKDLATELGVSASTVSRALAGLPSISPATQRRVRELAHTLNFRPNLLAAGLRTGRTGVIGVVVPCLTGHFFPEVLHSITTTASRAGLRVIICESNEDEYQEQQHVFWLLTAQVDGLLIASANATANAGHVASARRQGVPVVFFHQVEEPHRVDSVVLNNYQGAYDGVSHLLAQGCTRVAHLSGPAHLPVFRERQRGYADALRAHGRPPLARLVRTGRATLAAGRQQMLALLDGPVVPDAVFASQDVLALGAMQALRERGLRIPEHLALVSFASESVAALAESALTFLDEAGSEIGRAATHLLLKLLADSPAPARAPRCLVLSATLLVRSSAGVVGSNRPLAALPGVG